MRDRYGEAIIRSLKELSAAWSERMAMSGLEASSKWHKSDFYRISYYALFNSMLSRMIKVLDTHRDSASFWYIHKCSMKQVESKFSEKYGGISHIVKLSDKLKYIRDKVHFHIDRNAIFNPQKVWDESGMTIVEIKAVMQHLLEVLYELHIEYFGNEFSMPDYTGDDAYKLVELANKNGLIS